MINKYLRLAWQSFICVFAALVLSPGVGLAVDIVTVTAINQTGTDKSAVPMTFGQVFKEGDVPAGTDIGARLANGTVLTTQVDKKATHVDGSLRHAIMTLKLSSLAANASEIITLYTETATVAGTSVQISDLLATGFDASVSLNVGGTVYGLSAANLLSVSSHAWLSGPEVSEWIVGGTVKTASGSEHPHLAAYFHIRAYSGNPINQVRVDVVVENGWTMVLGPNKFVYDATVEIDGVTVYTNNGMEHKHHSRWRKTFWWGSVDPTTHIKPDALYAQTTKALPYYELTAKGQNVGEPYLSSLRGRDIAPMDNADWRKRFGGTGASDSIAPLPRWTAAYVVSGDYRASNAMLANADAAGTYYIHYRDENTGYPMKITDHPNADLQSFGGTGQLPAQGGGTGGLSVNLSHMPSIGYAEYLFTGDYFYLEEMQFWSNWGPIWRNHVQRNYGDGLLQGTQVRGVAWGLRNLTQAAYATPDDHPLKTYFVQMLNNNIDWFNTNYASTSGSKHNPLGVIDPTTGRTNDRPWMDDFFTYAVGRMVELGFTNAIPIRDFKLGYVIGRVGKNEAYCWQFPTLYSGSIGPDSNSYFTNFDEYWEANWGGEMAGGVALRDVACGSEAMRTWMDNYDPPSSPHALLQISKQAGRPARTSSYYANMQPAAAIAADSGLPGADLVRSRFFEVTPVRPDYSTSPQWGIVPTAPDLIFANDFE
ncbi:hypothetical protein MNBD_GAMMA18-2356 [hydrothermal vent metagenome]|uniref:Uncharacterized protein n=1 Tax=hydrothermal vent metagenome TaxID=652676 RepID=A0A3B0ZK78_9ZZZZ